MAAAFVYRADRHSMKGHASVTPVYDSKSGTGMPKRTGENLIVRISKSEAVVTNNTSSSAVAKRPRDASCLSVVSFSSTKRRAQSFIVSYTA